MKSKAPADPQRQLMIKTTACQRLTKEVAYYKQEVIENKEKLQEMKGKKQKTVHDIKKFEEVLGESRMMIPDSKNRLDQAVSDVEAYLNSGNEGLEDSEWYGPAQEMIQAKKKREQGSTGDDLVEETNLDDLKDGEAF